MEIGSFLGKLKGKEKEELKQFLALVLTDEVVQAAVWQVVNEQTEIVALGTPVEWDGDTGTTRELITAVDATISSATEGMTQEPNEIILGILPSWTDKAGILGSKRDFIKNICHELELKPLGYVAITDSVLSYLKMQEGTPATSILIQVSRDELTLVLVRLGHIENLETIGRGDDVVTDVLEGIARFKVSDNLPSRIILFNNMHNLDEISQSLIAVEWQSQFKFLHIPKVETLPKDVTIRALALAGGSEVAKSLGFTLSEPEVKPTLEVTEPELVSPDEIGFGEEAEVVEEVVKERKKMVIKIPKIDWHFPVGKKSTLMALSIVMILTGGALWFTWILPSAQVDIWVTPKILDQEVDLTLSTTDVVVDITGGVVPAKLETTEATGEKIVEATGKKTVGEKAKGEVTIYNRTTLTKIFPKGTSISNGSLKYTLDSDVSVASKSAGSDYIDVPGKTTVAITAATLGSESNLAAQAEFTIMNFGRESYVAKNESALTGGTAEEIQVVAKEDQKSLVSSLTEELLTQITANIQANSPGEAVYLITSTAKVNKEQYSAKVGEQAKTLQGNLTLAVSILHYQTSDVTELINSNIDQAIPAGFVRSPTPATVELTAETISDTGDQVKGQAKVQIALLPNWDLTALSTKLKGKRGSEIAEILEREIPGFQEVSTTIVPKWLPPRFKTMPRNAKKILITISPDSI
ncbi:MAG: hypothetical protein V1487_00965 [bacterium]